MARDISKLQAAHERLVAGDSMKAVLDESGLHYSPVWLFHTHHTLATESRVEFTPANVARLRNKEQCSWGLIAVRCSDAASEFPNVPESRVRAVFATHTGTRSQGLRNGAGGRYYVDPRFYEGDLVTHGTQHPAEAPRPTGQVAERAAMLVKLEHTALLAMAGKAGLKVAKVATKAEVVSAILRAERTAPKASK